MLELEIQHNLELLDLCYKSLTDSELKPFPILYAKVFESQISTLPTALKDEEITKVFKFYNRLETLQKVQRKLLELQKEWREINLLAKQAIAVEKEKSQNRLAKTRALIERDNVLAERYVQLWEKFKRLLKENINTGNPLQPVQETKNLADESKAFTGDPSVSKWSEPPDEADDVSFIDASETPDEAYYSALEEAYELLSEPENE
ncbi:hypothetical protein H6F90_21970 [Trichocoleus sp. FACHB-591]|uniref:hypothetical protein n=1 Tax=Trichocoleus sp. FACHB-591 TaxID=2692872 RepID=UPI0016856BFA|nr:hypothetical protein [Trichocoleus sp. FACHB-591]MBD2097744.1 hypothetical protein [Trichocoleus sp. FACHB-591]